MNTIQREINNMTVLLEEQDELIEQIKTRPMIPSIAIIKAIEDQGYTFDEMSLPLRDNN